MDQPFNESTSINKTSSAKRFSDKDVEVIERKTVYHGFFRMDKLRLRHRLFDGSWSEQCDRELMMRRPAAACLLYDPKNQLVGLIEQFRVGAFEQSLGGNGPWLTEVVAGFIEPGESVEQLMRRELVEEAGIDDCQLHLICEYLSSPGSNNGKTVLFCASANLASAEGVFGLACENEQTRLVTYPIDQVLSNLYSGPWQNATTLLALQWLAMNWQSLA